MRDRMLITYPEDGPKLRLSQQWDVLGPFQIGTREASWGADPLEYRGGFSSLSYDPKATFHSSLAPNGRVSWSQQQSQSTSVGSEAAEIMLTVQFPEVDWQFLQSVYGWAAMQYQTWSRGYLVVESEAPQHVVLCTDNVLEFVLDGQRYFGGDFYAYRRAPLVLFLEPGAHTLELRLIRDVRVMGADGRPKISVVIRAERSNGGLRVLRDTILLPDVVDDKLAGTYGSMSARNEGSVWVDIWNVDSQNGVSMLQEAPLKLAPGQSRPIAIRFSVQIMRGRSISFKVTFTQNDSPTVLLSTNVTYDISTKNIHEPHKMTFLHPGGTVSYAIVRAPSVRACTDFPEKRMPILLNLHGAGLEADCQQVRHMLDSVPDIHAWVLFPTGVTQWSGDDWHSWGFADIEAAVASIQDWIYTMEWKGPSVDLGKWLISGHSNGGQGTWYALTHIPDKIIGAAPVSGYSSIQNYVPYQMWNELDPRLLLAIHNSLQSFRHELLVPNFQGIPIIQQHGSADDNVPAFHSRRLNYLVSQSGQETPCKYVELEGKGHWFDGVMTTMPLRDFYSSLLNGQIDFPALPERFSIVVANPADMGPRGGVLIDQLCRPDQLGKIGIERDLVSRIWTMETSNIARFHFISGTFLTGEPSALIIDGRSLQVRLETKSTFWFVRLEKGGWEASEDRSWLSMQRHTHQLGPLHSILRTRGPFTIRSTNTMCLSIALQISRNLFQYFAADSEIIDGSTCVDSRKGNIISVAVGRYSLSTISRRQGISIDKEHGVVIRRNDGTRREFGFREGVGAIFLGPLGSDRLELIVWGFDDGGLQQAARLLPMLTGVGQPEFIVVSKKCSWAGAGGVLAMGSFDNCWNVTEGSFIS